ncbi:MAG TPA: TIGR01777 family oxidoreductase [Actinocrinis sp.]|nr:TIGR01777 family oxidoreductase [Actinocrinis sp.]
MRVVISGSTGLIGQALAASLLADGHTVTRLVRREPRPATRDGSGEARWDPHSCELDPRVFDGADAVVGLAGAGVGEHRWTDEYKQEIRDSRVHGTTTLATAMARCERPPSVFVSASAIGYYGDTGDTAVDERGAPGHDFLADVCLAWEEAAHPAALAGIRVAHPRFGLVVSAKGGAFGRILPLARAGLGGRMGDGRQYWSCVSLTDAIAGLRHIIGVPSLVGPVNVTGPEPITNRQVTAIIGRALRRPTVCAVPGPALRLAVGEFAEGILMSQRVLPARLLESGFSFTHPTTEAAIHSVL